MSFIRAWRTSVDNAGNEPIREEIDLMEEVRDVMEDETGTTWAVSDMVTALRERRVDVDPWKKLDVGVRLMLDELVAVGEVQVYRPEWWRPRGVRLYYWIAPMQRRVNRARRARVMVAAGVVAGVALSGAVVWLASDSDQVAAAGTVTASATTSITAVDTAPRNSCGEESECFNSCVQGVDGRYPTTDARHGLPGPCDLGPGTVLPYGRRLDMSVQPAAGATCGPADSGWAYSQVSVFVIEPDGREVPRTRVSVNGCVQHVGTATYLGSAVDAVLPQMYAVAGARA